MYSTGRIAFGTFIKSLSSQTYGAEFVFFFDAKTKDNGHHQQLLPPDNNYYFFSSPSAKGAFSCKLSRKSKSVPYLAMYKSNGETTACMNYHSVVICIELRRKKCGLRL